MIKSYASVLAIAFSIFTVYLGNAQGFCDSSGTIAIYSNYNGIYFMLLIYNCIVLDR